MSLSLALGLALTAAGIIVDERRTTLALTKRGAEHLTQILGVVVDQMIRDVDGLAAGLQMALTVAPSSDGTVNDHSWQWLAAGMEERPAVRSYHLMDRRGEVRRADRAPLVGQDMAGRRHFRAHLANADRPDAPHLSDPIVSPTTGYRELLVSWPLRDAGGDIAGVLAVGFDTGVVESRLGSLADSDHDVIALVKDARVILAASGVGAARGLDPLPWDQGLAMLLHDAAQAGHEQAITRTATLFGSSATWLVDLQPLQALDGSIVVARNLDGILDEWRRLAYLVGGGCLLLIAGIFTGAAALTGLLERQRQALAAATTDALTDPLTRLFNRRMLEERATSELARARALDQHLVLLLIDIDHFKRVNDRFGHAAGDAVLIAVARRLLSLVRRDDLLARIGGEEFAVLAPGLALADAFQQAERLRQAVADLRIDMGQETLALTISIGVAPVPIDATSLDTALEAADAALYEAKTTGRNRTIIAGPASPAPLIA